MTKIIRNNTSGAVQLSPNFFLSEFTHSDTAVRLGIENSPDPLAVSNMFKMASLMEEVRKTLGNKSIFVSSCFRSEKINKAVGSGPGSDHLRGEACDFTCPAFGTPLQIAHAIVDAGIKFGQLICEGSWTHLSLPTEKHKQEVLTAHFAPGKKATYTRGL